MDEIIPGLWIGDLPSALDTENLKANKIYSILSAMRGRITINETFIQHQILLDDTEEADILIHFLPSIAFIQAELDKGRGVLVHCHAGMSRSATIVAAYLMYSRNLDCETALDIIRKARPNIAPNDGFLLQLEVFHKAAFKISRRDKTTRMFYMERAVEEVMNGDGTLPETDMFAKYPRTPSDSTPATPGGPRRRIRCKMCRQELATREHMLDHGQLGPPTPAMRSPATSRRPSMNDPIARRPSIQTRSRLGSTTTSDTRPRRPSLLSFGGLSESLSMSALETEDDPEDEGGEVTAKPKRSGSLSESQPKPRRASGSGSGSGGDGNSARRPTFRPFANLSPGLMQSLSMSALETEDEGDDDDAPTESQTTPKQNANQNQSTSTTTSNSTSQQQPTTETETKTETESDLPAEIPPLKPPSSISIGAATLLGRRLSDAVLASPTDELSPEFSPPPETPPVHPPTSFISPSDLAAQLYANPKLAALRSPMNLGMTPMQGGRSSSPIPMPISSPILANSKCSGYFVEPMKWMEPFLESGQLAGKIVCPNKKCGAKLGNYDWAGVCCSCKQWVTPGFCIHRSKVDEVI